MRGGKYFEGDEFKQRQDCIYERVNGRLQLRSNAGFHTDEKALEKARISDLGAEPSYPKANALVAKDFRYFGKDGKAEWKSDAPELRKLVETLGQGHRVNLMPDLRSELVALKNRVWDDKPDDKVLGTPLHPPDEQFDYDSNDILKVCKKKCFYIPPAKQHIGV